MLYYPVNKIIGRKIVKKSVIIIIFVIVSVSLLAGAVFCGIKIGQKQAARKVYSSPRELVTPIPDIPEVKFLQMVIAHEEPAASFKDWDVVPLDKLPKVIQQEGKNYYQSCDYDEERTATVCRYDLDHDGEKEWIIGYRNNYGNSGSGYHVFSQYKGKLQFCGEAWGLIVRPLSINGRHGIFQKYRMGGGERIYTFYELTEGKLQNIVEINLKRAWCDEKDADFSLKLKSKSGYTFDEWF